MDSNTCTAWCVYEGQQFDCYRPAGHKGTHVGDSDLDIAGSLLTHSWADVTVEPIAEPAGADDFDMDATAFELNEPVLATFRYGHLPRGPVRSLSADFAALAVSVVSGQPRSAERTTGLRHLWDAKNYAVYGVSTALRGTPDSDGQVVGAERVREGSSETVPAQEAPAPLDDRCGMTWSDPASGLHRCEYDLDHAGAHRCGCGAVR